ncbi:gliding motility-associated C-terminal domain-containing protein [Algoriphagus ornithinivorans]|uniref:Gliding motility-associated C-terminal domain-containing protein n=1 Tax=Algoriphagus ornithinivorans TaxID=226506 RepID=A0A1I5HK77_9BACT|nr:gliding motility-associated C-terminal domain-containing protein [Algoriphagus ornithinivorans]
MLRRDHIKVSNWLWTLSFLSNKCLYVRFLYVFVILFLALNIVSEAQVVIPRDGFPYCEPFTNSTFRQNTVLGGAPIDPVLTAATGENPEGQGFLRLTNNNTDQRGYVYVDLPFSSAYGLKFSFEYFMYGGSGADGISVFLFDGNISAADFQIGGWGGSLGYAPINATDIIPAPVNLPGLKGGYLGLGLDAFKNWGNNMEGRLGSFDNPNAAPINLSFIPPNKEYFQSIAVRGPESDNYRFIAGKRVLHGPDNEPSPAVVLPPSAYLYPNVADISRRFSLASPVKVVDCNLDGYRKVFVNLAPTGTGTYLLSVDLLVTENGFRRIEPIITNVPYNFPAPDNLKIGFAASTGGQTNFHEIRNVTVEVSDYLAIPIPEIIDQRAEICKDEENLFEFDVTLTSENSFVRCVQLFETDPGTPDNSPPTGGDPDVNNCGASDVCIEKCNPANNSVTIPGKGTFTVVLDENVDLENDQDRIKAAINFVPEPGFVGEAQIYYQVIDNYGLTSFGKTVTVISNPFPEEIDRGDLEYPTCDGQSNGRIFDVTVGNLVPGFDYQWLWQPSTGPEVSLGKSGANVSFDPSTGVGVFDITGINIGTYTLQVWNPSDGGGCYLDVPIVVDQELGTPIELTSENEVICEFQPVSFTPFIDGVYNPSNIQADFRWYQNANRTGPLLDNTTVTIGGAPVQVSVVQGVLTLTGLPANGASTQQYEFFVEVAPQDNPSTPNFCPFIGDIATSATVIVHPAIQLTQSSVPDWCREGIGSIAITATGGNGPRTFTLFDESGTSTLGQNSDGQFAGLLPGTYQVEVTSQSPSCFETIEVIVQGPDTDLTLNEISRSPATCELNNGEFTFQINGGNTPYNISDISISGGPFGSLDFDNATSEYRVDGLAPNTPYTIEFRDARSCLVTLSFSLDDITKPVFSVNTPPSICESDNSYFLDVTFDFFEVQATATPIFNWYTQETGGSLIPNGTGPGGMDYFYETQTGDLTISNLSGGVYTLYLEMSGPESCNLPRIPVNFEIFDLPEPEITSLQNISCFGGNDGAVTIGVLNGNIADFEFQIDGLTNFQNDPFFTGLTAGSYTATVRNKTTGCVSSIPFTLDQAPVLNVALSSLENTFCGEDNGIATIFIEGGTPAYTLTLDGNSISGFDLSSSGITIQLTDLASGNHQIVVTDSEGCQVTQDFVIQADPFAEFSATGSIICESDPASGNPNTAVLSPVIIESASASPVFTWFYLDQNGNEVQVNSGDAVFGGSSSIDSNGNLSLTGVPASSNPYTFLLEVTGDKVCSGPKISVELIVNPLPNPEFSSTMPSCFNGTDGEIFVSAGESNDYAYQLLNSGESNTTGTFTNLSAGTYSIQVTNTQTNCLDVLEVILDQPEELIFSQITGFNASCNLDNGSIELEISGGTAPYKLFLDGAEITGGDLTNPGATAILTDLAPKSYIVLIEDSKGCSKEETIIIDADEIPEFGVIDSEICEIDPTTRNPNSAVLIPEIINLAGSSPVFAWFYLNDTGDTTEISNGQELFGAQVSISSNGEISLTGLSSNDSPYQLLLQVSGDGVCQGPMIPGSIIVNPLPQKDFDVSPLSCFESNDGRISLIGDPAGYTYTINTGESNQTGNFSNLAAGIYEVRVEDSNGCFELYELEIVQPEPLAVNFISSTDPSCGDSNGEFSFAVQGGTPDYSIEINGQNISTYSFTQNGQEYTLTNLAPGDYSIEVVDQNNCSLTEVDFVTLVNNDGVQINSTPISEEICVGQIVSLTPDLEIPAGVQPQLTWYKTPDTSQPINSSPNPDANGLVFQINSNGELSIQNLPAGDYIYYLRVSGPGICAFFEMAEVKVYPPVTADIDVENVVCFGANDGSISVLPSGGNGVYEVSFNGGAFGSDLNFQNLSPGTYSIEVRNDLGCTYSETVELLGPDEPIQINSPSIVRASCDLDNGSISGLEISSGWGSFQIEWRAGSINGQILQGTESGISDLAPGTYYLIVQDAEGCEEIFEFIIERSSDPVYQLVPPINSCVGNDVSIRPIHLAPDPSLPPASATEVRWYKQPNQNGLIENGQDPLNPNVSYTINDSDWLNPELIISGLPAGDYSYYFFVVCTGQEIKVDLSIYETPSVELEVSPVTCFGDTNGKVTVTSGDLPDYTYSLDGGSIMDKNQLESLNLVAGDYQLEIFTPANCSQLIDFTVEGPSSALTASPLTGLDPGCGAANGKLFVTVTGGWAPYQIDLIKNGSQNQSISSQDGKVEINGLTIGDYSIRITDSEGCQVDTNLLTLVDGPTQILVDDVEICSDQNATLIPELDPNGTSANFTWYFDSNLSQPITSSPNPAPNGLTYQYNSSNGILNVSGFADANASLTYYVTVSGGDVCEGFVGSGTIQVSEIPNATYTVIDEVCFGDGGRITVNPSGSTGPYTFSLNGGDFVDDNIFEVAAGTYSIEVMSATGCSVILSDILVNGPQAAISVDNPEIDSPTCGLDNGIVRFELSGGFTPYTVYYQKSGDPENNLLVASEGIVSISGLGLGDYQIRIVDGSGCEFSLPQSIEVTEIPTEITVEDQRICEGQQAILSPRVPQNILDEEFTWFFDSNGTQPISNGSSGGVTYSISSTGELRIDGLRERSTPYTYYVNVSGTGICGIEPKPVQVFVSRIPDLRVSNPSVVCDPQGTVDLTQYIEGFNPAIYDYDILSPSGAAMQISDIDNVNQSGDYRVRSSTKGSGCWNEPQRIRVIIADELVVADFDFEVELFNGQLVSQDSLQIFENILFNNLSKGKVIIWNWDFGDGNFSSEINPTHFYEEAGTYLIRLTVIDEFGCSSVYEQTIQVSDEFWVEVPTAFTPDRADGKNNFFKPVFRGIASMEFYIFTTWGELIYETSSLEGQGWDGYFKGRPAPNGNYVFRGKFTSRSGEVVHKSGVFILIR